MTITIDVKDSAIDKFLSLLDSLKNEVKIKSEDVQDLFLLEEAKKDKSDMKTIDELLKEYKVES
jgi:hypothetical protein